MQRKQVLLANRQIRKLGRSDVYKNTCNHLMSVSGIGTMTAITFLVQIADIKRFTRLDEPCNYVELVPSMHGSGEKMDTGELIKKGNEELKIMLIEAGWVAVKKYPALMAKFTELMPKMNKNNEKIKRIQRNICKLSCHEYY